MTLSSSTLSAIIVGHYFGLATSEPLKRHQPKSLETDTAFVWLAFAPGGKSHLGC
jgi:hypothetical protein